MDPSVAPGLIGAWRDVRARLARRGIMLTTQYGSQTAYNVTGGERPLVEETGQFVAGATIDLDKVAGLHGGTIQATLSLRRGRNLSADAGLGTLLNVQEVYGRGQTFRVSQLWYEQAIGARVRVKLGRTNTGEDFDSFPCDFQNLTFCGAQPGVMRGDYILAFPVAQWGVRFHVDAGAGFYVRTGAYDVNPHDFDNDFFVGHFQGSKGVLIPGEIGWQGSGRRAATYKIGGWYSTADGDDVFFDSDRAPVALTGRPPLTRRGAYGAYVAIEQQITGRASGGKAISGLSLFLNAAIADRATSMVDNQVRAGFFYRFGATGNLLALGLARTHVNARVAAADRLRGEPPRSAEYVAELYYEFHPVDWMMLRPNVQWIARPGAYEHAAGVGVAGLKALISL